MIKVQLEWVIDDPAEDPHELTVHTGHTQYEWDEMDDDEQIDFLEDAVREDVITAVSEGVLKFPWWKVKVEEDGS